MPRSSRILDVAVGLFGAAMSTAGTLGLNSGSGRGSIGTRTQEIPVEMIAPGRTQICEILCLTAGAV